MSRYSDSGSNSGATFTIQSPVAPKPPRASPLAIALMIVSAVLLAVGLLVALGVFLALRGSGLLGTKSVPANKGFESDMMEYREAIAGQLASQVTLDPEVEDWITAALADLTDESDEVSAAYDEALFIQAAQQSPWSSGLGLADKLAFKVSLAAGFPAPDALHRCRILSIERMHEAADGEQGDFAVANLLFYDNASQAISARWFLAKTDQQWKLYDWERMEYGRRMSDEWASYFSNFQLPEADGYDESMRAAAQAVNDFQSSSDNGDSQFYRDRALSVLRKEESRQVLPLDQYARDLRIAWTYQTIGEFEESLRVLQNLKHPQIRWGALSSEAQTLLTLGRYEEALAVSQRFLDLVPGHPNGLEIAAQALDSLDRADEARPYLVKLLRLCPENEIAFNQLLSIATPEDLPFVVELASADKDSVGRLESILYPCFYTFQSPPPYLDNWRETSAKNAQQPDDSIPDSFWRCVEAGELHSQNDSDGAAEILYGVASEPSDRLHDFARYQLTAIWTSGKRYRELVELLGAKELIQQTLESVYWESEEVPDIDFLAEIERADETEINPEIELLRGVIWKRERPADAETALIAYLDSAADASNNATAMDDSVADDDAYGVADFGAEWARALLTEIYLATGRVESVLNRFGSDDDSARAIAAHFRNHTNAPELEKVLERLRQSNNAVVEPWISEIRAAQSCAAGDALQADRFLVQAISQRADAAEDDAFDWEIQTLASRRADYAVLNRQFDFLKNWPTVLGSNLSRYQNLMLVQLANKALDTCDALAIEACQGLLEELEEPEPLTRMEVVKASLIAGLTVEASIAEFQSIVSAPDLQADSDSSYQLVDAARRAIDALLIMGRTNVAAQLNQAIPKDDSWFSGTGRALKQCMIDMRAGNFSAVSLALQSHAPEDVAQWLQTLLVRALLLDHPEVQKEWFQLFPPRVEGSYGESAIVVLFRGEDLPSPAAVTGWLESAIPQPLDVVEVPNCSAVVSLIATLDGGSQWLVSVTEETFDFYSSADASDFSNMLKDSSYRVVVEPIRLALPDLESDPFIGQRVAWEVAVQSLGDESIAVYSQQADALMQCKDTVADQWKWMDRIPLNGRTVLGAYGYRDRSTAHQSFLNERMQVAAIEAANSAVEIALAAFGTTEWIPAEFVDYDDEDRSSTVRLTRGASLRPEFVSGCIVKANIESLRVPAVDSQNP